MDQLESCVPPGFRFHPTEEELVGYYLNRKINSLKIDLDVIIDIDLYKMEPWDIQGIINDIFTIYQHLQTKVGIISLIQANFTQFSSFQTIR